MTKNRLILIALVLTLLGGLLIWFVGRNTLKVSRPVAIDLRYPSMSGEGKTRYFNGSAFMEFDLVSQSSRSLTPSYWLPSIADVRWSKTGVIFQATEYGPTDDLHPVLVKNGLPTGAPYWWEMNFQTGAVNLIGNIAAMKDLGAAVDDVVWTADGKSYYYTQAEESIDDEHGRSAALYSAVPGGAVTALGTLEATDLLWADSGRLIYKEDSHATRALKELAVQTRKTRTLASGFVGPAYVNPSGSKILFTDARPEEKEEHDEGGGHGHEELVGPLKLYDTSSGTAKTIREEFSGVPVWSPAGDSWAAVFKGKEGGLVGLTDDGSGKIRDISLKPTDEKTPENLRLEGYSSGQLLLGDDTAKAYLAAKRLPSLKDAPSLGKQALNLSGHEVLLNRGVSKAQVDGLKYSLRKFSRQSNRQVQTARITNVRKTPRDRYSASTSEVMTFTVSFDDKQSYNATMQYFDLTGMRLLLADPKTNVPLHDSGSINLARS